MIKHKEVLVIGAAHRLPTKCPAESVATRRPPRGSLPVGELLVEIDAEGGAVALPLLCLVEAANSNPDDEHWLDMLLQHPATEVVGIEPEFWKILAAIRNTVGRVDAASAALMALDYDIDVATRTPGLYAGLGGGEIALPLED